MTPEKELAALQVQLRKMQSRVAHVEESQHTIRGDHEHTRLELSGLVRSAAEDLSTRYERDRDRLREEVRADLEELRAQVATMQRLMRRADGVPCADLDPGPELDMLAQKVKLALYLEHERLDGDVRAAYEAAVEAWAAWERDTDHHRRAALDAGVEVVARPPGRARRGFERHFLASTDALDKLAARREDTLAAAEYARAKLAEDDERRHRDQPSVSEGAEARTKLVEHYARRVDHMRKHDMMAPEWFERALGHPSGDGTGWRELAVDVLVYRAVFVVTDAVVALGRAPDGESGARQRAWHGDLADRLAARP